MSDSTRRILTIRSGQLEPLIPRLPLLSSANKTDWRGVILEKHLADSEYTSTNFEVYSNLVHIFSGVPVKHEWNAEGRTQRVQSIAGNVLVVPKGLQASVQVQRSKPDVQWILEFDLTVLEQRLQDFMNGKQLQFSPQFDLRDPQVMRLAQSLQADIEAGCPAGSLFGETLSDALAIYLTDRDSNNARNTRMPTGGLSRLRLNRVLEYIQANLDRDIHLDELSGVAEMSSFYFARMFKESVGSSPHQYILQRRLELAKELLQNTRMSLSEISLRAGFSDQSHLTNVFRRFIGMSPSIYRGRL